MLKLPELANVMLMTWNQTFGMIALVGMLLAGCRTGNPVTIGDRVTLNKGEGIEHYELVNVDPQGRAEFGGYSSVTGSNPKVAHTFVAPGQKFGGKVESTDKVTTYDYRLESTDPAKQQVTVLINITTTPK